MGQESSCNCCIKGKLLDIDSKEPIAFATVRMINMDKYALTTVNGEFMFNNVCPDTYSLSFSSIGFTDTVVDQKYKQDEQQLFYLSEQITGLDQVVIKGERIKEKGTETIAQTTITKTDIQNNSSQSLAASLAQIEGVSFTSKGTNVQLPVIQGLSGNRILILNNGIKHGFQTWGTEHAPEIDINAASKITVIKGAAGARFGPEALSGVILVEPDPLNFDKPLYASLGTTLQRNGQGGNVNFNIGTSSNNWSFYLNGSHTKLGDSRAPRYILTNTGKEESAFGLGLKHRMSEWEFRVDYSFIDQNLALLRSSVAESPNLFIASINADRPIIVRPFSYDINEPNQLTQHHLAKADITWNYKEGSQINLRAGYQVNKRDEFDVRRNADLPIIDLDLETLNYQLEWEHPIWNGLEGLFGFEYYTQNSDNNPGTLTTPFIPNYNLDRFSFFATEKLELDENTFELGARIDMETTDVRGREPNQDIFRDRYTFTNITGSIGYKRALSENSTLRTNLGTAFRTPNVAELFSFGQQGFRSLFGLLRVANIDGQLSTDEVTALENSKVDLEIGYKLASEFQTYNDANTHVINAYIHYIDNFVFDRPLGVFGSIRGPQFSFFYDQADALFIGLDYDWKRQISQTLSTNFGLSYLWSRNIGEDEPLINQVPISTNLELQWDQGEFWILEASTWKIRTSYTFRQFQAPRPVSPERLVEGSEIITETSEIFDFVDAPDGYFLLDLSWSFKYNNLNASIAAQNILNSSYRNYLNDLRYFADEPGINLLLSLNYKF